MRVVRRLVLALAVCLSLISIAIFFSLPAKAPAPTGLSPLPDADRRATGVLHVHSLYSDGLGDLGGISRAASEAGLDFVVLTDHRDPGGLGEEGEGYDDGVLRLIGVEISNEGGHLLALEIPDFAYRFGVDPAEVLRDIEELEGFAIVAHPSSVRPNFAWTGWDLPGFVGAELFNFFSGWRRQSWWRVIVASGVYPFSPGRALALGLEWDPNLISEWDRLLEKRDLAAWAGLDAHGQITVSGDRHLPWPTYRAVFGMVRNYLILDDSLSGELGRDRALVYQALGRGQGYISFDGLADGSRFSFYARGRSRLWPMGSHVPLAVARSDKLELLASVQGPPKTRLRLLRNGELMSEASSGELSLSVEGPGVYRVEARLDPRYVPGKRDQPWIVSNPIYVLPEDEIRSRRERLTDFPPLPTAEGLVCRPLVESVGPTALAAEHDPASIMDEDAARSSDGVFEMQFTLAEPSAERPYVWCSAADRTHRDLSGFQAMRLRVKGDDVYRVDFQLRDSLPESPDEGTEWWATSFKTSREWKEIVIPFDQLTSITEVSDRSLDLDQIQGMFFVLDAGNTRPGTSGRIEIQSLELCASAEDSR